MTSVPLGDVAIELGTKEQMSHVSDKRDVNVIQVTVVAIIVDSEHDNVL